MKIAIMQPYFFPYIGYFQLINASDIFVIYDKIKFTKKGWINRNRILQNGVDSIFTVPLKNDSDFLNIDQRYISSDFNKKKIINRLKNAYKNAPYFDITMSFFEDIIVFNENNLFKYIFNSLLKICEYLDIKTKFTISSSIKIDNNLKAEKKVLEICKALNANMYINAIGGIKLYSKQAFFSEGIDLKFIISNEIRYRQFNDNFVPSLSIIDTMMFNSKDQITTLLNKYDLI
ncbi:MAG: WbqC family protein [Candidatus Lokiarchaeota archaeon]|nr:WbqC family protein [Candidatus Lokiarchaeota archaeon]